MSSPVHDPAAAIIYRAPWLVPVTSPVLADGAVLVQGDRIRAIGSWQEFARKYSGISVCSCLGVLMPGLVNAHIHLELSIFGTVAPETADSSMCDWIRALLQKRMGATFSEEEIFRAAEKTVQDQYAAGVVLLLDTGNNSLSDFSGNIPEVVSLLEMLGPSKVAAKAAIKSLNELPANLSVTGHAPYSTSPELLQRIKKRSCRQDAVFSLHVAENRDESLLLLDGKGCFYDFLEERGALDGTFPLPEKSCTSVIEYLNKLELLDTKTICVHCVHVSTDEIKILAQTKSHVCLCPGSNRFLHVGRAPLEQFLENDILPALGTDSIASNPVLDMWQEMVLSRQEHPDVTPQDVLRMATLAGARALHRENDYGSLESGQRANFLNVQDDRLESAKSAEQVLDILTSNGRPDSIVRICE